MERYLTTLTRKRRHSSRQGASSSQDEGEQPPRSRLRTARTPTRTSSSSVEIVDVTPDNNDDPIDLSVSVCVVDLTEDTDTSLNRSRRSSSQDDVVDLTGVPDGQPHADRATHRRRSRRSRPTRNSQRINIIPILSDSDEENDIMVLPEINICNKYRGRDETPNNTAERSRLRRNGTSPHKRIITCPICMEDESSLRNNGRQLMSTNCGHVFCHPCIRVSIQTQHRCPTCRKKLTIRQIHPIFL